MYLRINILFYNSSTSQIMPHKQRYVYGPEWNTNYKSTLCERWLKNEQCPYYSKCQFAHGYAEQAKWNAWRKHRTDAQKQEDSVYTIYNMWTTPLFFTL